MIKVVAKVKKIFADYGFEPNIAFNLATERAAYINIMIIYDKEVQSEDQRALKCYKTTTSALKKYGIMPYRLTTKGMSFIHPDVNYSELIKSLKKLVDPNNILMPGRYDFS
jgi:4-cresol dehydrogenase (hydroxylating)